MKWIKVENHPENSFNHYYVSGEKNNLLLTIQSANDELTCKLPDGSEKKMKLNFKLFEVINFDNSGTKFISTTKKWFVNDDINEYPIEEIEVSKDDIMQYNSQS